jgi:hypothetical protein
MSPAPLFTPQEEEQLKQKLLEEGQWKSIDAAIDRIQTRLAETKGSAQATREHARKLWGIRKHTGAPNCIPGE